VLLKGVSKDGKVLRCIAFIYSHRLEGRAKSSSVFDKKPINTISCRRREKI
jgi:hypothetical protein